MTQATNLILDALVNNLNANMNIGLVKGDLEFVSLIKKGLLQEDKVRLNIELGVTGGDHENPDYKDAIVTDRDLQDVGINWGSVAREIGGGQLWWRRGVVKIECFFIGQKLNENDAHVAAYNVLGRLMSRIERTNLSGIVDEFDERPIRIYCHGNTFFESGGPPSSYIFRGKVFWACLTERP